jgi:hypothetical protein
MPSCSDLRRRPHCCGCCGGGRWIAAAHWLAAFAFGFALTGGLAALVPDQGEAFGVPSLEVTMATITFGFFAVLIARELPGRDRAWPYLVSGGVVTLLGFAELYLGAHWLSDVVGAMFVRHRVAACARIAYRRHVARSFWMRPVALAFYGVFAIAALWHAPRVIEEKLALHAPAPPPRTLDIEQWWATDWAHLPARRDEIDPGRQWGLDFQFVGAPGTLQRTLQARGWRVQPQAGWVAALGLLDDDRAPSEHVVLPATLEGRPESLLFVRALGPEDAIVLRVWLAPMQLREGPPLWIGTTQRLHHSRPIKIFGIWRPVADDGSAHARVRADLSGYDRSRGRTSRDLAARTARARTLKVRVPAFAG